MSKTTYQRLSGVLEANGNQDGASEVNVYACLTSLDHFQDSSGVWSGEVICLEPGRVACGKALKGGDYFLVTPELLGWMEQRLGEQIANLDIDSSKLSRSIEFFYEVAGVAAGYGVLPVFNPSFSLPKAHPMSIHVDKV